MFWAVFEEDIQTDFISLDEDEDSDASKGGVSA